MIFVDGDFWHGKDWKKRKIRVKRGHNPDYWVSKIERNIIRDRDRNRKLRAAGWTVLRVWESDIRSNIGKVVDRVKSVQAHGTIRALQYTQSLAGPGR